MNGISLGALFAFFLATGLAHFLWPAPFLKITPPWVPYPRLVNLLAGAWECVWALALLAPRCRETAVWALIALLVAVFPANLRMLMDPEVRFGTKPLWLYLRLPFQGLLIFWVRSFWNARLGPRNGSPPDANWNGFGGGRGHRRQVERGRQCLLFTALVGSTHFCSAHGDSVALARVHEYFLSVTELIKASEGAAGKTMGGACMVALNEPAKALAEAVEIQRRLQVSCHLSARHQRAVVRVSGATYP